jgi:hypothetical protein
VTVFHIHNIRAPGLIIAVLSACNKSVAEGVGIGDFSTDDELLLEALSLQFGLMLSNCLTYEKEMAERRKASALAQLDEIINAFDASSSAQLFPMCYRVAELGRTLLQCDKSNVFIVDYLRSELFQASGTVFRFTVDNTRTKYLIRSHMRDTNRVIFSFRSTR